MGKWKLTIEPLEPRSLLAASAGPVNPVVAWNAVALDAIRQARTAPPQASRDLAIVQASVFDAVNSIDPTGPSYLVRLKAPAGASAGAAVAGAASEALTALFPNQGDRFLAALSESLAALPAGPGTDAGLALGKAVADRELAARASDGSAAKVAYTPGNGVGVWQPTPPAYAPAVDPQWGKVTPFVLRSADQFKPPPPPAVGSATYNEAVAEVRSLGAKNSTTRTADQTQVAEFWNDGAGTATPPGHWNEIAEQVANGRNDSLVKDARVFAVLDLALADAAVACWSVKYQDSFWRPVTAIRAGGDASWSPLITTPAFPSYVSGHSTFSGAAAAVLSAFYGSHSRFTTTSDYLPGVTRSYTSFQAAADEAGMSRIYGGIHYPFDNTNGLALGRKIGRYALSHAFGWARTG